MKWLKGTCFGLQAHCFYVCGKEYLSTGKMCPWERFGGAKRSDCGVAKQIRTGESASYCLGNGPALVVKTWDRAALVACIAMRRVLSVLVAQG